MVFVKERKIKGKKYLYLEKSVRDGKKVHKVSKYLGNKDNFSNFMIKEEVKEFKINVNGRLLNLIVENAKKKYSSLEYPLNIDEIKKIEEMNLKYKKIKKSLTKLDWQDVKKRFVANFVFESNALEGNSLTLKNFSEIVFENKIINSADLREVYDAKNSFQVFSDLFKAKKDISEDFIISLHRKVMKNIDNRFGYKKIPNMILGSNMELTDPGNVPKEMKKLLKWYDKNKQIMFPLELALKFHHKFEKIHPFSDGNGRVGRLIMNYILMRNGYYPLIVRKSQRNKYIKALESADRDRYILLMRFGIEKMKETYRKFFAVYYNYV
jgi:Fic family protein